MFFTGSSRFSEWAAAACRLIRFGPDREKVFSELVDHMQDACDALIQAGETPERAAQRAVEQMGDAAEVARQLQKIHRPFWGWLWKYTRVLAGIAAFYLGWVLVVGTIDFLDPGFYTDADVEAHVLPGSQTYTVLADVTPQDKVKAAGYTISIERATLLGSNTEGYGDWRQIQFVLRVSSLNPWQQQPMFQSNLTAVDNLGNVYPPRATSRNPDDRETCGNIGWNGTFVSYYELWISAVDPEATSFSLGFDDYGVQWSLDFSLEGGGQND